METIILGMRMTGRPTIADVAARAGVSVATVDRVLNGRRTVRAATADRVVRAAEELNYHATALLRRRIEEAAPRMTLGFLLQKESKHFYRQLAAELESCTTAHRDIRGEPVVAFVDELSPNSIVARMRELAERVDALAVVAVDHPHVTDEIERLRDRGIPTVTLLSHLSAPAITGHVGVDGRKAGRTAAWAIARCARQPGDIGILIGSHRYLGQEDREIGFRSYFRENFPEFRILEPIVYLDDSAIAYDAAIDLLHRAPGIVGLYLAGGGVEGVLRAVREEGAAGRVAFACHELTPLSRQGLIEGAIDLVVASPIAHIAEQAVDAMVAAARRPDSPLRQIVVPFEIHVSENA